MRSLGLKKCGDVNLRGKKSKLLSCRCCEIQNLKDKVEQTRIKKEVRDAKISYPNDLY